ncbi:proline-rich protein 36 [Drosophila miranda]|uniref:proline-rich protein 36 n=1 Tax=Drosophila miranda TaxID=7229 RepID=UPI0007E88148|nr:proline-rich protein 36 [Drosophila miranda]
MTRTTTTQETRVEETIEISSSNRTVEETIDITTTEGSLVPKQRHHHQHHHHHHHHRQEENVEVVEEVVVLEEEPQQERHKHKKSSGAAPPPPLPQSSPPFLTPTEDLAEDVVWEPQPYWSPSGLLKTDQASPTTTEEFAAVEWSPVSNPPAGVVQEESLAYAPPTGAPPQLQVQTTGFPPAAQSPLLSPIEEVVQTELIVESQATEPAVQRGFIFIPRESQQQTELIVESESVEAPQRDSIPPEGFVKTLVETFEVGAPADPPIQMGYTPRASLWNKELFVETVDVSPIPSPPPSPPLDPYGLSSSSEDLVETEITSESVEEPHSPPAQIPAPQLRPGFIPKAWRERVETIVEGLEVVTPPASPNLQEELIFESLDVTATPTRPPSPPVGVSLQTGFMPRSSLVETELIVESLEVTPTPTPPPSPPAQPVQMGFNRPQSAIVETATIVETVESVERPAQPPFQPSLQMGLTPRESLVQEQLVFESFESSPEPTPPPSPPVVEPGFMPRASVVETELIVESLEVTPTPSPPDSPIREFPFQARFIPRASLAETELIVESLEATPTPTPPASPPAQLRVKTGMVPPPNLPQTEVIIESVEVTPTPTPTPQPPLNNGFVLTDLVLDSQQQPALEVVETETEIIMESGQTELILVETEERLTPVQPASQDLVLVGVVAEESSDKLGKRYSVNAVLKEEQISPPTPPPKVAQSEQRDAVDEGEAEKKRRCCPCRCVIA